MNSKYKSLLTNTAVFAISNIISKIILSLLLPLYTRTLTTEQYGTIELITTISQLLYPALSLSIQDAAFRFSMDKKVNKGDVLHNSLVVIVFGFFIFIPVSYGLSYYHGIGKYSFFFYVFSTLSMLRGCLSLYVKGINKTIAFSIDAIIYNLVLAFSNITFLIVFKLSINGYFYSVFIALIISIIYLSINSSIKNAFWHKINKNLLKEMIVFSAPLVLNSISWGLTHVVDRVMLTNMIGLDANGIYSAASKIPALLSLFTSVFTQAWTISLIQDYEGERDENYYNNIFMVTHLGCIFISLGILLFNNNLLVWILGSSFSESAQYVPVLLLGSLFLTYSNFFAAFFSASKKSVINMYTSLAGAIFNVVFNFALIPIIGILGACIATAGSYCCISVLRIISGLKIQKIDINSIKFCLSIISLVICSIFVVINWFDTIIVFLTITLNIILYKNFILFMLKKTVDVIKKHK